RTAPEPNVDLPAIAHGPRVAPTGARSSKWSGRAPCPVLPKGSMEKHHDEHIDCADCGAPFVFSADEAAVFEERGLAAPKRCKDCRRARKERAAGGGSRDGHRPPFPGGAPRWSAHDAPPVGSAPHAARARGN